MLEIFDLPYSRTFVSGDDDGFDDIPYDEDVTDELDDFLGPAIDLSAFKREKPRLTDEDRAIYISNLTRRASQEPLGLLDGPRMLPSL